MTPDEVGARLVEALGGTAGLSGDVDAGAPADGVAASVSDGGAWARATVDVPAARWRDAMTAARDALGCDFFDWLSAVDELDAGYAIVAHVWSTGGRYGALLRTTVPRHAATVESIVDVYPGAAWHERETAEMFGVDFPGHPGGLKPLLLPQEFEGHPLRKDFVLASRVAKPWPGAKEPGEGHGDEGSRRQPMRPPGVPDPSEWGPGRDRATAARHDGARGARGADGGARAADGAAGGDGGEE